MSDVHREDSNCRPQSVVMVDGSPSLEIHTPTNALATESAVIQVSGIASGQRVIRSTHVGR